MTGLCMMFWTHPSCFFKPRFLHTDILCEDCLFIPAGDWKFCVNSGFGELEYQGKKYKLGKGDCVFIDCRLPYSHSTDKNLWFLSVENFGI